MSDYKFETLQLHVGQEQADPATDARAVPIYQTTSYVFHDSQHAADRFGLADAGNIYGRLTNSTQEVFEKRIAALEGGIAAMAVASGAAAIAYTLQALAANRGHIVAQKTIYGGTYNLLAHTLPQYGIDTTFVNVHDLEELEAAIQEDTRAIFFRNARKSQQRYSRHRSCFPNRPSSRDPRSDRQYIWNPFLDPAHRVWRRYCRPFGHKIHRRSWNDIRRSDRRLRQI